MSKVLLPCIGGFNDGKFIEPNGREMIRMAKPSSHNESISHRDNVLGFDYEIYSTVYIPCYGDKALEVYAIEGMKLPEILERLILGYKQFKKRKRA